MTAPEIDDRVQEHWQRLRPLLDGTDLDQVVPQRVEKDRFETVPLRARLAELAFWVETCVPVIADLHRAEVPIAEWYGGDPYEGWPDNEGHRSREAKWASKHSTEDVLARLDLAHHRMRHAISTLTQGDLAEPHSVMGFPPFMIEDKMAHAAYGPYEELSRQLSDVRDTATS